MRSLAVSVAALLLAACASERIVLLPSRDGRPSALVLQSGGVERELKHPYAATLRQGDDLLPFTGAPEWVQEHFASTLAAQPLPPRIFTVNFPEDSVDLTPPSAIEFDSIKAEIKARPAAEILVVGHTDRVGTVQYNDELSLRRARAVRDALVAAGIPGNLIETAGRGEREPLVPTADEVVEPRNRRVEISVR